MTDCFVSYKREDEARVQRIVQGLRDEDLTVWWDRDIPGGERWRETIVEHLDSAGCVVVCWTVESTGPRGAYVREEAERAKARGVLLPVFLDPVAPPFGFGEVQALDLQGWTGSTSDARWQHFVATVRAMATGQPRPKRPLSRIRRWSVIGAAAGAIAVTLGFINDVLGLKAAFCATEDLRGICRGLGLGGVPSLAEEAAWTNAQRQPSGDGYRDYLRNFPQGTYVQAAQARLAACRKVAESVWQAREDPLPLFVPADPIPAESEAAARDQALPRVQIEARDTVCALFSKTETYKLRGIRLDERGWRCQPASAGWRCGYDGKVICEIEVRSTREREACGLGEGGREATR